MEIPSRGGKSGMLRIFHLKVVTLSLRVLLLLRFCILYSVIWNVTVFALRQNGHRCAPLCFSSIFHYMVPDPG